MSAHAHKRTIRIRCRSRQKFLCLLKLKCLHKKLLPQTTNTLFCKCERDANLDKSLSFCFFHLLDVLPPGSEILQDIENAPAEDIYYLAWSENYYCLFPNIEAAIPELDNLGIASRVLLNGNINSKNTDHYNFIPVVLSVPSGATFPFINRHLNDVYLIAFLGSAKQIILIYDRDGWDILGVAKSPTTEASAASLLNEYKALSVLQQAGTAFAPAPLAVGMDQKGLYASLTFQSALHGERVSKNIDQPIPKEIFDILFQLRNESYTSLTIAKDHLTRKAQILLNYDVLGQVLPNNKEVYQNIEQILSMVGHKENILSSMFHGDFKPSNLLRSDEGKIFVLDWELFQEAGVGFLDAARYVLEDGYRDDQVRSFEQLFTPRRVGLLEETRETFFDGSGPNLWELLALHVVQHFLDRIEVFKGGRRVDRMWAIMESEWPA